MSNLLARDLRQGEQIVMEKIIKFTKELGEKKLIEGVTREEIELYMELKQVIDGLHSLKVTKED